MVLFIEVLYLASTFVILYSNSCFAVEFVMGHKKVCFNMFIRPQKSVFQEGYSKSLEAFIRDLVSKQNYDQ